MNLFESVNSCIKHYATFSGKASKSEYWWFWLVFRTIEIIWSVAYSVSLYKSDTRIFFYIASAFGLLSILLVVPFYAVTIRRLRDAGYSESNIFWRFFAYGIGISLISIGVNSFFAFILGSLPFMLIMNEKSLEMSLGKSLK